MINSNTPFLNELNVAVVDTLLSLSHHLNSGMIGSFTDIEKTYDIDGLNIKIHCEGGVDNNREYIVMNADKLTQSDEYERIIDYHMEVRATGNEDGGFGSLIRKELDNLFNKEKAVPDYVVESLNSGYSCIMANNK